MPVCGFESHRIHYEASVNLTVKLTMGLFAELAGVSIFTSNMWRGLCCICIKLLHPFITKPNNGYTVNINSGYIQIRDNELLVFL